MNNTFNINRFGLLIRKQWLEYGKLYLIALGIVAGVLLIAYSAMYWQINHSNDTYELNFLLQLTMRWQLFGVLGILFLSLAANHYFAPLSQKPKAILELTLPASSLEKFLTGILFSTVFALLSYFIIFYLVDLAFVSKLRPEFPNALLTSNYRGTAVSGNRRVPDYFLNQFAQLSVTKLTPFFAIVFLNSMFLLGSLYFNKFQYLKTVITTLVFLGIWIVGTSYLGRYLFENRVSADNSDRFNASSPLVGWGVFAILLTLTIITYTITYVRFKEKEV